jgi:hypothetical protein
VIDILARVYFRDYYAAVASSQPEEASNILKATATLSASSLFSHPVQETVLDGTVDHITLGWTRMLQAVLDLAPPEDSDKLLSKYHEYYQLSL